jgi:Spy/CpxP family protein refolding chaperone
MRRGWFVLLALSIGLNAGLLYAALAGRTEAPAPMPPAPDIDSICIPAGDGAGPMAVAGLCEPMMRVRMQRMAERLSLDEGQREQMNTILSEMLPQILAGRDAVQRARLAVHAEYRQPQLDAARIRMLTRDLNASQARVDSLVVETMLRESALLSPAQRAGYFEAMPWDRRPVPMRMGVRRGPGNPSGKPPGKP